VLVLTASIKTRINLEIFVIHIIPPRPFTVLYRDHGTAAYFILDGLTLFVLLALAEYN
jgi:hypothetical protein